MGTRHRGAEHIILSGDDRKKEKNPEPASERTSQQK